MFVDFKKFNINDYEINYNDCFSKYVYGRYSFYYTTSVLNTKTNIKYHFIKCSVGVGVEINHKIYLKSTCKQIINRKPEISFIRYYVLKPKTYSVNKNQGDVKYDSKKN